MKKKLPNAILTFSNIIVRKDKKNLEKLRADTNVRLKNYCAQKKLNLINHDNIKESHLGIRKLHLNRKGNSLFPKNLLSFPAGIYLLKVNNRNTRTRCEICSKLTINTPERRHWRRSGVFIVNFEHISHLVLVFLLLTLNK